MPVAGRTTVLCYTRESKTKVSETESETHMEATAEVRNALLRIQTEYMEMPDLKLTSRQAQRLWHLTHDVWETALAVLIGKQFLVKTRDGAYVRFGALRSRAEAIESLLRAS